MDINSLQGASAYANTPNTTFPVNNTLQDQNLEASKTDLNTQSTNAAQKAFEVSITREAQDRLATETSEKPAETQASAPENQTEQNIASAQKQSQIVNIVA
ncbi:MAG: hypothetical protein GXP56_17565 [Deltaproteobacteria bacterium]|nr:hypothetical protein [Deltaproteobacteria bacterium]